jgi:hypothetical protein
MEHVMLLKTNRRRDNAPSLQKVLTEFGCIIKCAWVFTKRGTPAPTRG